MTLPLYFKSLITNTCGRCPADKPPGMMHAIPGQSAFTREHNEPRWRNRLSTRLLSPRATYKRLLSLGCSVQDHIRYENQLRHSAHAIPSFSHPAPSLSKPHARNPPSVHLAPHASPHRSCPVFFPEPDKREKNEVKMRFRSIPKILRKITTYVTFIEFCQDLTGPSHLLTTP